MIPKIMCVLFVMTLLYLPVFAQSQSSQGQLKIPTDLPKPTPQPVVPQKIGPVTIVTTPGTPAESPHKPGSPGTVGGQYPISK